LGRRWGNEGYQDGTFYGANSFFAAVEKKLNDKHSLNITGFYTPNRRGKSSPNTQEIYDLKDITYNEYWGYQEGQKRNSRVKRIAEPVFMLSHYWNFNTKTRLNSTIAYQFGALGNSRLDYAGGANPSPAYYQTLPSFFLADRDGPDLAGAYEAIKILALMVNSIGAVFMMPISQIIAMETLPHMYCMKIEVMTLKYL
jgi:hypothetical protein